MLAVGLIGMGALHFVAPEPFVRIVPGYMPAPRLLVSLSGLFEILGGIGLLVAKLRQVASIGVVLLFIAVFPANVNMAMNASWDRSWLGALLLWLRIPLQAVLIAWALWVGRPSPPELGLPPSTQ